MLHFKRMIPALLIAVLPACEEATGPAAGTGEVEVAVVGDDGGASTSMAPAYSRTGTEGTAEGTVTIRARVYVRSGASEWVEVTNNAAQSATVDASGGETKTLATGRVTARSYDRVRVVFEDVDANVTGGVQLGLGNTLQGHVSVDFGGSGSATVEREVRFLVAGGAKSRLTVNLNSDAWLSRADAESRAVSRADFESAVRVVANGG